MEIKNDCFNLRLSTLGLTKEYLKDFSHYQRCKANQLLTDHSDDEREIRYLKFEYQDQSYYIVMPLNVDSEYLFNSTEDDDIVIFNYHLENILFSVEGW